VKLTYHRSSGLLAVAALATGAVLVAGFPVFAAASTAPAEPTGTQEIETVYGTVESPAEPQRVVAVSYETPWQLQAVGVTPVGILDFSPWADSFTAAQQEFIADVPTVGTFGSLNFEAIADAAPDVIIGDAYEIDDATFEQLSRIAPTVIVGGDVRGDWKLTSTMTAQAAGAADKLEQAVTDYDALLARLQDTYADVLAMPWAHFSLGDVETEFSVQYPTGATGGLLFGDLGATLAPSLPDLEPIAGYESFSTEELSTILGGAEILVHFRDPDGSVNALIQGVIDNPLFATLPAAADGHVYGVCCQVFDYVTATLYLDDVEATILEPNHEG